MKRNFLVIAMTFCSLLAYTQSAIETTLKAGEVLLGGLTILKASKKDVKKDSPFIASICIKNKLAEKITFRMEGTEDGADTKKEMVVQADGKECVFNITKGIYTYEVILSNKEIYKKGEYKFDEDVIITVKNEN